MANTRSTPEGESASVQSHSNLEQELEERRESEAVGAAGGLASGTLHYLDNLGGSTGSSGNNAGEAKYSAGAVS